MRKRMRRCRGGVPPLQPLENPSVLAPPWVARYKGGCANTRWRRRGLFRFRSFGGPFGHPSLGLLLIHNSAGLNIRQARGDLLAHVDVVLNVPERGVVGDAVE